MSRVPIRTTGTTKFTLGIHHLGGVSTTPASYDYDFNGNSWVEFTESWRVYVRVRYANRRQIERTLYDGRHAVQHDHHAYDIRNSTCTAKR